MPTSAGDRSKYFPAIEKKHGEKIHVWLDRLGELGDAKYPQQIAYLRENFGFSQVHANAVVMFVRGSTTSKRFATPQQYFASLDPTARKTVKSIFATISQKHPTLELVIAWNQPVMRVGGKYVIGISVAKNHLTINPFSSSALESVTDRLKGYNVNKKTFTVPRDWKVNASLLHSLIKARLAELS